MKGIDFQLLERRMIKVREISTYLLLRLLVSLAITIIVHGQNQTGFISLDCGKGNYPNYYNQFSGIYYTSDASFIDSGVSRATAPNISGLFDSVRSFPQGTRNCYTITPRQGKGYKYLIRVLFLYGNYDMKAQPPEFDLHLGVEFWDTVKPTVFWVPIYKEIIHVALSDYIHVCLVNTGRGTPFISALELRPLKYSMYDESHVSLNLISRLNFGHEFMVRYKSDLYDRLWEPYGLSSCQNCKSLMAKRTVNTMSIKEEPPAMVIKTGLTPAKSTEPLRISLDIDNPTDYYICVYTAELETFTSGYRIFDGFCNGELVTMFQGLEPSLDASSYCATGHVPDGKFELTFRRAEESTRPPLVNAMEIYGLKELYRPQTYDDDVAAILKIKVMYGVTRNWNGDPCTPKSYVWSGLGCNYNNGSDPPRIISMNMSAAGLKGLFAPSIANLTMLTSLDLSQNNLTGPVPAFLSDLAFLRVLYLKGNYFTGSVPAELIARSKNGFLFLSFDGEGLEDKNPCLSKSCKKKSKSNFVIPIVAPAVAFLILFLIALAIFCFVRRRKKKGKVESSLKIKNRQFTFLEVQKMTNDFQRVVGKGGFGIVYHGYLGETQVAVKMLSPSSSQGYKEFHAEANLLINVHHKNLTSLVGFCNEGTYVGLIYEYMANGNLEKHLSEKSPHVLSWQHRVQIAMDAAQGLEYLHHGCKPAVVHRDVKTTNILLDENVQAKLSDFGLSRVFSVEGETHVSTVVAGTPGYLDPEYYTTNRLTEKSDVYSFGVVLLEMITSQPTIVRHEGETHHHIVNWISPMLASGDIRKIADPRLDGNFDVNSVWKAVELAMACVSPKSAERPTMNYVVNELKECLATEMAGKETAGQDVNSTRDITTSLDTGLGIMAR